MAEQKLGAYEVGLYAVCCGATLAIGSVHATTQLVLGAVSLGLLLALGFGSARARGIRIPPLARVMAVAMAWTAFQLVPLPVGLLSILSSKAAVLRAEVSGRWAPITLDAPATALELVKQLGYVCVFLVAVEVVRSRHATKRASRVLAALGVVVACLIFGHRLLHVHRIYGIYELHSHPGGGFFAPFVNSNHAASLLALCALAAFGLAAGSQTFARLVWLGAGGLSTVAAFSTASRGGALALCIGGLMLLTILATAQFGRTRGLLLSLGVLLTLSAGALLLADGLRTRFVAHAAGESNFSNQKTRGWLVAAELAGKYPLVGAGRGAFEAPAAELRVDEEGVRQIYAENVVLQMLAEWGIPITLGLLTAAVWFAVRAIRRMSLGAELAALTSGVVAVTVHGLLDCGFEFPGVMMPWLLALGALIGRTESDHKARRKARPSVRAWVLAGSGVLGILVLFIGASSLKHLADVEADRLREAINRQEAPSLDEIEPILARHPASMGLEILAGEAALQREDANSLRHFGRAMRLQPSASLPHRLAAIELVRRRFPAQAALEYRLAIDRGASINDIDLIRTLGKYAIDAVPRSPEAYERLGRELAARRRWNDADVAFDRAAELDPGPKPRIARAMAFERAPVARRLAIAEALGKSATDGDELSVAVRELAALHKLEEADTLFSGGIDRYPTSASLIVEGARVRSALGDVDGARHLLLNTGALDSRGRLMVGELAVELAEKAGDQDAASAARARLRLLRAKADLDEAALGGP